MKPENGFPDTRRVCVQPHPLHLYSRAPTKALRLHHSLIENTKSMRRNAVALQGTVPSLAKLGHPCNDTLEVCPSRQTIKHSGDPFSSYYVWTRLQTRVTLLHVVEKLSTACALIVRCVCKHPLKDAEQSYQYPKQRLPQVFLLRGCRHELPTQHVHSMWGIPCCIMNSGAGPDRCGGTWSCTHVLAHNFCIMRCHPNSPSPPRCPAPNHQCQHATAQHSRKNLGLYIPLDMENALLQKPYAQEVVDSSEI